MNQSEGLKESARATTTEGGVSVHWDDSAMRSLYANVVNVTGTREEVTLLFGLHQAWQAGTKEVTVQLLERIILSPFAAKRLQALLGHMIKEYETRYGPVLIGTNAPGGLSETLPTR